MRRSVRKFVAFTMAVAVMTGSMWRMPVGASEEIKPKENGDLVMETDYIYDSYQTTRTGIVALASDTEGEISVDGSYPAYFSKDFTENTEIYIINANGSNTLVLENDGEKLYENTYYYITGSSGMYSGLGVSGKGFLSKHLVWMDGAIFEVENSELLVTYQLLDNGQRSYDIWNEIICEKESFVVTEHLLSRFVKFGNGYVMSSSSYYEDDILLVVNDEYEIIQEIPVIEVEYTDEFVVCVTNEYKLYTIDKELNVRQFDIEIDNRDQWLTIMFNTYEAGHLLLSTGSGRDYDYIIYDAENVVTAKEAVEYTENGFKYKDNEITKNEILDCLGLDTSEEVNLKVYGYDYYLYCYVYVGDFQNNEYDTYYLVLLKDCGYSPSRALKSSRDSTLNVMNKKIIYMSGLYYYEGQRVERLSDYKTMYFLAKDQDSNYLFITSDGKVTILPANFELVDSQISYCEFRNEDGEYIQLDYHGNCINVNNDHNKDILKTGSGFILYKDDDDTYKVELTSGRVIELEYYIDIVFVQGDYFVLKEEQEDGTLLYGVAKVKPECIYGDATGDDKINVMDAVLMKKYIAGFEGLKVNLDACDVNVDGKVNVMDAVMVLKYIAGFDVILGG